MWTSLVLALVFSISAAQALTNETYWVVKSVNQEPIQLTPQNMEQLLDPNSEKLVFIIHGWVASRFSEWYPLLTNSFLSVHPTWTVVQVDWSVAASPTNYYEASNNTIPIGANIGNFISTIIANGLSSPDKILIAGHSLGGHVSGFAGKAAQKSGFTVSRIVGLDPAFPPWNELPCENRLCKTDAEYLQVIHTDIGAAGMIIPIGYSDFYPNGGTNQTGCGFEDRCNHMRAVEYFIEGVSFPNHFKSLKCPDYNTYITNKNLCDKQKVYMADLTLHSEGVYYLQTNAFSPYSKNN